MGKGGACIERVTQIGGGDVDDVITLAETQIVDGNIVPVISLSEWKINKRERGRAKDLDDIENLP